MRQWYPKYKQAAIEGAANVALNSGTVRVMLVDLADYTYSDAHDFLDDVPAGARVANVALSSITTTDGVFDAADAVLTAVTGDQSEALIYYKDTGTESTSRLICFDDGTAEVEVAVAAGSGATSVTVEDLPLAIASGATLTLVSGTGPSTLTTTASAAAGARALTVSAAGSAVSAGALYRYNGAGTGLPVTPNGGNINLTFAATGIARW